MKNIAIVYHSGFGHTEVIAQHIYTGVQSVSGIEGTIYKVDQVTNNPEQLNVYDSIIMGAPTYMGSLSAPFKAFMDATSTLWFEKKWQHKIAAGFTNGHSLSGDKLNSLVQLAVFAAQHGMIWVNQIEPNMSPDYKPGKANVLNRMGSSLGLMAQSENDSPTSTPPSGDIETAELFGQHIANITKRFNF